MKNTLFTPKDRNSAVDYVINEIKRLLIAGDIKPGEKLPSEFELAEGFGVSRGSIRSAMKVFEAFGIIDIRPGDGTYIRTELGENALNPLIFSLLIINPSTEVLVKFREKIELDIFELIIQNDALTQAVLPILKENLSEAEALRQKGGTVEDFAQNDQEFHSLLAKHCNNIVFETVYHFILEFFYPYLLRSHHQQISGMIAAEAHQKIYDALKKGDFVQGKAAILDSMHAWYALVERKSS